jgi:hypothetical protein
MPDNRAPRNQQMKRIFLSRIIVALVVAFSLPVTAHALEISIGDVTGNGASAVADFAPFQFGAHIWATTTNFPENYGREHLYPARASDKHPFAKG